MFSRAKLCWILCNPMNCSTQGFSVHHYLPEFAQLNNSNSMCIYNWYIFLYSGKWKSESEVAQSCPTLCDPMHCSLPGSSAHGIFQAGILEWVAISFSRGSSEPRNQTCVSCIVGGFLYWPCPTSSTQMIQEKILASPHVKHFSVFCAERFWLPLIMCW